MDSFLQRDLLMMLWQMRVPSSHHLISISSEKIVVLHYGERSDNNYSFSNCKVEINEVIYTGTVVFLQSADSAKFFDDTPILNISNSEKELLFDMMGNPIPQAMMAIPKAALQRFNSITECNKDYNCGYHIAKYEAINRVSLFTNLFIERLNRKSQEIFNLHESLDKDWNRTLYTLLFRSMGGSNNKLAFQTLATKIPLSAISREGNSITAIEALLLGTSGLMDLYPNDKYTMTLRDEFNHLSRKYSIVPMNTLDWNIKQHNPHNHPVLRIVQLAVLITSKHFLLDQVLKCSTKEDTYRLFCVEASDYWMSHFVPGRASDRQSIKSIGKEKAELLGINFVGPMQFAYGDYLGDEDQKERVIDLLENLGVEKNYITKGWKNSGVKMENAFDSQAMIQLHTVYCTYKRCGVCAVGKKLIKESI